MNNSVRLPFVSVFISIVFRMGNCLFINSQQERVDIHRKAVSPSMASTASVKSGDCLWPLFPEFVTRTEVDCENPKELRVIYGPESFVVIDPSNGIVLVSVSQTSQKQLCVSTPDGRSVANVDVIEMSIFELNNFTASKDQQCVVVSRKNGEEICRVAKGNKFVGPVPRGTDLVVVCVLVSAAIAFSH